MSPTEVERAWAAGFFDGEGCTSLGEGRWIVAIVTQVDRRPLDRFHGIMGFGRVHLRIERPGSLGKNPIHTWKATRYDEVLTMLGVMWPYLSEQKREQAKAVILAIRANRGHLGKRHSLQKLNLLEVEAIRVRTEAGRVLAAEYGVSQSLISKIRLGKRWV